MTTRRSASSHAAAGVSLALIIERALALIAEVGVAGLTMQALAEGLGVRAPSLYHHVGNKQELLELVARDSFASFAEDRDAYDRLDTIEDWITLTTSGTRRLRHFYARHPGLAALIQSTATDGRDQRDGTRAALIQAQIGALLRLGIPAREARQAFETSARWTMAAVAAENTTGRRDAAREDALFTRGLEWLMHGLRAELEQVLIGTELDNRIPASGTGAAGS